MVVTLVAIYIYIYIDNSTKNKNGLKVTKNVTLFTMLNQKINKQRLMLEY